MTDDKDTKTIDMLPGAPVKRGRPATGHAMTAAERKRASREKAKIIYWDSKEGNVEDVTTTGLIEQLLKCVTDGHPALVSDINAELLKRAKAARKEMGK